MSDKEVEQRGKWFRKTFKTKFSLITIPMSRYNGIWIMRKWTYIELCRWSTTSLCPHHLEQRLYGKSHFYFTQVHFIIRKSSQQDILSKYTLNFSKKLIHNSSKIPGKKYWMTIKLNNHQHSMNKNVRESENSKIPWSAKIHVGNYYIITGKILSIKWVCVIVIKKTLHILCSIMLSLCCNFSV